VATVLLVVVAGLALPAMPFAPLLGFRPLPPTFYLFVGGATVTYLAVVERAKAALVRRGTFARREVSL
jgi:Mg2+-importing ATPase